MIDLHNAGPLIAEVARLREEVAALKADVARLCLDATSARAVAVDAIGWLVAARDTMGLGHQPFITELRERLAAPDPAAFVAAVDAYGKAERDCNAGRGGKATEIRDAARAALLALGGVR